MIDYIVGLFYNHRYVRLAIKQTVYYCILIYLFGLLLDLYLTKVIHFNFFVWSESFHENSTAIVLILVGITLLFRSKFSNNTFCDRLIKGNKLLPASKSFNKIF